MRVEALNETRTSDGLNLPLPTDQAIYRNLSGAALDWDLIEADLGSRAEFSGVVDVIATDSNARAYYLNGQMHGAYRINERMTPCDAATLRSLALQATARLSVYAVTPVAIELSLEAAGWRVLHQGAGVEVTRSWLEDMHAAQTTGALEVSAQDGRRGVIAYVDGVQTLIGFEPTIAPAIFGNSATHAIETISGRSDVQVRVYGNDATEAAILVVRPPEPEPVPAPAPEATAAPTPEPDGDLTAIVAAWSAVLALTETRSDAARGAGTFDRLWRASCLELADQFLELDPFMNDVIYTGGTLTVNHASPTLTEALTRAYLRVLVKLGVRPEALAPLLVPIHDQHRNVWQAAGLETVCRL